MPTADLAAQRALLKLADTDRQADAAAHRRTTLPEIAVIDAGKAQAAELRRKMALADVDIADVTAAARKLDGEIDSVRQRAAKDAERLASGAATPKEMEGLQREVESLARRQSTLEDDALELMERLETAQASADQIRAELTELEATIDAATVRCRAEFDTIDAEISRLQVQRATLVSELPEDVLAVYERVRSAGKTAAATLTGDRCDACGMALDRAALDEVRSAAAEVVPRCPECSALLVRNP